MLTLEAGANYFVLEREVIWPPAVRHDGQAFLVAGGVLGAWRGFVGHIAFAIGGEWLFVRPQSGMFAWLKSEERLIAL